jgi:hypothetical protein
MTWIDGKCSTISSLTGSGRGSDNFGPWRHRGPDTREKGITPDPETDKTVEARNSGNRGGARGSGGVRARSANG